MSQPPFTVLVVDDEPEVATLLTDILELAGYAVQTAGNGAEALEAIARHTPDAIISDVMMPVLDGYGFYRELEAHRPELCRRIAFVAARADAVEQFRRLGVPVLAKPFRVPDIQEVMRRLLGQERES